MPTSEIVRTLRKKPKLVNIKGSDPLLVSAAVSSFISFHLTDTGLREFNLDELDCADQSRVRSSIMEAPLGVQTRVIVLRGEAGFIKEVPEFIALISLDGTLKSADALIDCRTPRGRHIRPAIRKLAKIHELELDKTDVAAVASLFPGDLATLDNVFTLTSIAGKPYLATLEHLLKTNSSSTVWTITKAIIDRNTATALRAVQDLLDCGVQRVQILGAITRQARLIALLQAGVDLSQFCADYEILRLESLRGTIKIDIAMRAISRLSFAEREIKSGIDSSLEEAIIFLCKQKR